MLAVSVLAAHTGTLIGVTSKTAVQVFFVISGYLIAFVLNYANNYESNIKFWLNRFLRIYPLYLAIAFLSLCFVFIAQTATYSSSFLDAFGRVPNAGALLLGFSNTFIFLQDLVMFLGVHDGHLAPVIDFNNSNPVLHTGLLVPQAWSLSLELYFYLLAPYFVKSKTRLWVVFIIATLLRAVLILAGFGLQDPWSYRFFPVEIGTFAIGALAYHYSPKLLAMAKKLTGHNTWIVYSVTLSLVFSFQFLPGGVIRNVLFMLFIAALLPVLFTYSSRFRFDKWLGELSYPIYVSHFLVISCLSLSKYMFLGSTGPVLFLLSLSFSILFSLVWLATVDKKIQGFRKRVKFAA